MRPVVIRLKGLAGIAVVDAMRSITQYDLGVDGDDVVLYADDPALDREPVYLVASSPISVVDPTLPDQITMLWRQFALPELNLSRPKLRTVSGMGFLDVLDRAAKTFYLCLPGEFDDVYETAIRPLIQIDSLGLKSARLVCMDVHRFYHAVAFPKVAHLAQSAGPDAVQARLQGNGLMNGVMPGVFEPLSLLRAYLSFRPYTAGIALQAPERFLILDAGHLLKWDPAVFRGLPRQLAGEATALGFSERDPQFPGPRTITESGEFVDIALAATNRFWGNILDPRTWTPPGRELALVNYLQALSTARFLVQDVHAVEDCGGSYGQTRLALQFMDKLTSLLLEMAVELEDADAGMRSRRESEAASVLMAPETIRSVATMFFSNPEAAARPVLKRIGEYAMAMAEASRKKFAEIHRDAGVVQTQDSVKQCVRVIRNLAHGSFLGHGQFEDVFIAQGLDATLPPYTSRLPWLYMLAFGLDPRHLANKVLNLMGYTPVWRK